MIKSYPQHHLNNLFPFLHSSSFSSIFFIILSFTSRIFKALWPYPFAYSTFTLFLFFFSLQFHLDLSSLTKVTTSLCCSTLSVHHSQVWWSYHSDLVQLHFAPVHCTSFHQEQQKQQLLQLTHTSLAVIIWSNHSINNGQLLTSQMISPVFH